MGECIDVISSLLSFCLNRIKQLLYVRRSLRSIVHKQFEKLHYLAVAATNAGNFQRSRDGSENILPWLLIYNSLYEC